MPSPDLDALRRFAVARTLFAPTTLQRAIRRLGFVQADPIRAPARAQDLTLRHRVRDYRAGDLERRYPRLDVEEDCLVNYVFLPREHLALMHPRQPRRAWDAQTRRRAAEVLEFVRAQRRPVHPREVEQQFEHGRVRNYWGGSSNATTQLLDGLHYRGLLRVARRDSGTRVYAAVEHPASDDGPAGRARRAAALVDLIVGKYAPLPGPSLTYLVRLLGYGAPHLAAPLQVALREARERLPGVRIDGVDWYWPTGENPRSRRHAPDAAVRLLAPFDPVVWDRRRFTLLWGWTYRFEAYTPAAKRVFGYYALPMLWHEQVIGWANVSLVDGRLQPTFGYVAGEPKDAAFKVALDEELQRLTVFLS
ncbi:crosslink repair DNA glycosylase YcaQ family protein [Xanthomonas sp. XNM01]|uniref:DNA glycosylase AlkZ-like family protein n=1 Tax=Xanthomonas sp. XNM01 TaxID=2769289 RepID=UPI0017817260|nr:crosslink repair DNA glycosylase YcaQ family protein [Xanthomonas sp. XNM01]MBD9369250.1 YcaQ family DNA glycosylase [Xanthomonas sp. XNM01]